MANKKITDLENLDNFDNVYVSNNSWILVSYDNKSYKLSTSKFKSTSYLENQIDLLETLSQENVSRITALEGESLREDDLIATGNALETQIITNGNVIDNNSSDITNLQNSLSISNGNIDSLQTQITDNGTAIDNNSNDITNLQNQVSNLQSSSSSSQEHSNSIDVSSTSATIALDISDYKAHIINFTQAGASIFTINYSNVSNSGTIDTFIVIVKYIQGHSINWNNVIWSGGITPILTNVNGRADVFSFTTYNGGASFIGSIIAQNLSSSTL